MNEENEEIQSQEQQAQETKNDFPQDQAAAEIEDSCEAPKCLRPKGVHSKHINFFIGDAHFTSGVLASLNDVQSMKVTSAPNMSACFKRTITMHKQEQATPHIKAKPKHSLLPPYAVNP